MWTIFKGCIEFVTILYVFHGSGFFFFFFGHEAFGILVSWPGIKPALPALEDEVLATGPRGKSQDKILKMMQLMVFQISGTIDMFSQIFLFLRDMASSPTYF